MKRLIVENRHGEPVLICRTVGEVMTITKRTFRDLNPLASFDPVAPLAAIPVGEILENAGIPFSIISGNDFHIRAANLFPVPNS